MNVEEMILGGADDVIVGPPEAHRANRLGQLASSPGGFDR